MSSELAPIIRGVLIQVAQARLLLPNATIAEVLSFATPEPVENTPAWLLGRIRWRGWQLPLLSFSRFAGLAEEQGGLGSKVVVLKALGGDARRPYFALLTQGFPRLVTVTEAALATLEAEGEVLPPGVLARVRLNEDAAVVPDLETLEDTLREALAVAA
ncbi:chemotaxis protein CheW [Thermomonas sp.]|uniref:chemotaxis protein CheW n=1 Tax=Thermomonas sp. TaxID=1971895 RepID=UPI001AD2FCDA|nr:chemotaxis protein CheW [Xanthomonadales bacterium]MBN8768519.1 chemotaxis protein CheW [Stenotrophomonas sp.]